MENLLSLNDLKRETLFELLDLSDKIKNGVTNPSLHGKKIALLFEKPSLRTRASFEIGMNEMGGICVSFNDSEFGMGERESAADIAKVLSRYVDIIAARVNNHSDLITLSNNATIPIINSLSDLEHPLQTLADLMTIREKKGELNKLNITFIGDGNNVSSSLALGCALVGANFTIASPKNYELPQSIIKQANLIANNNDWIQLVRNPKDAVNNADVIYTDVWTSMGQDQERKDRSKAFKDYKVTSEILGSAKEDAIFMHDLPAHRGEEVEDGIIEHEQSVVFDQAENRLHTQKALIAYMIG